MTYYTRRAVSLLALSATLGVAFSVFVVSL